MSNEISKQILEEMLDHGVLVIKFVENKPLHKSIVNQIIRSATSVGANYSEAQDASSKKDFLNKIYIAKKESAETTYWLKLIARLLGESSELSALQDRTQRFTMILQKILNSSRAKSS
ncbi:MAG TPA: four helix bundle protein [Candidatus Saccharimonadales bacterium]|nr:four helix bundle protein [Candidatus Saccharimonadales bacterium]